MYSNDFFDGDDMLDIGEETQSEDSSSGENSIDVLDEIGFDEENGETDIVVEDELDEEKDTEETATDEEFDFDDMFDDGNKKNSGENKDALDDEIIVDTSKYANLADSGERIVLAVASGTNLVYLAHGTIGKLSPTIKVLEQAIGGALVRIPLGDENIDELKGDARRFEEYYKKYVEA